MKTLPSYILINLSLMLFAAFMFVYVYFLQQVGLPCLVKEFSGSPCATCGFTRAFNEFLHFNFELGKSFNELAMPVFIFFAGQVVLRVAMVLVYMTLSSSFRSRLVKLDVAVSISVFLLAFLPVLNLN